MRGGTENNKILSNELINFAGLNGSILKFISKKDYVLHFFQMSFLLVKKKFLSLAKVFF